MSNLFPLLVLVAGIEIEVGLPVPDFEPPVALQDAVDGTGDSDSWGERSLRIVIFDGEDLGTKKKLRFHFFGQVEVTSLHQFSESCKLPGLLGLKLVTKGFDPGGDCHLMLCACPLGEWRAVYLAEAYG